MRKSSLLLFLALSTWSALGFSATEEQPHATGIGDNGYVWNDMQGEKLLALAAKGDATRGEITFEICGGCHKNAALGRADGSVPRLAGQHGTVLIKQMVDIRAGRRDNPKMYPFANQHVLGPQDIADIAAYLRVLPSPANNGQGPGANLSKGKALYDEDCRVCHGNLGEGDTKKFYPRVAGQHYVYLLREAQAIRDGERRNANPTMVKAIKTYSVADLQAVSDYMSRLPSR